VSRVSHWQFLFDLLSSAPGMRESIAFFTIFVDCSSPDAPTALPLQLDVYLVEKTEVLVSGTAV
jgi:hypothetical protein